MHSYPSRSEKRQIDLYSKAEKGYLLLEKALLYPSEIKKLEKDGFLITDVVPSPIGNGLFYATIDWSHPYVNAIPHMVYGYINNIIETYPKNFVNTFAQELYVIARRKAANTTK